MQLSDVTNLPVPQSETAVSDEQSQQSASQSHDGEQAQKKFEVKSVSLNTLEDMQMEALKDVNSVNEALSLLRNLRDGSQISDSAHESLSNVFKLMSKNKEEAAASDSDKDYASESPSERHDAEMADEVTPKGIKVPQRTSASRPFKPPSSKRQQLTSEEAAEIYSMRPEIAEGSSLRRGCMVKSKMIAPTFGVTPKTVRDIWHARTWVSATRHLWTDEEIAHRARGAVESDEEDKNASSGSASPTSVDSMKLPPFAQSMIGSPLFAQNLMGSQLSSLPALSSLKTQGMMGGMAGLLFQLSFPSATAPSALPPFPLGQQQAPLFSHGMLNGLAAPMGFAGCHTGFGMGAHNLVLPEMSSSLLKM